ncbi:MAG: hypothetical protein ACXVKA_02995 [Acidimicrobiia bacterium]
MRTFTTSQDRRQELAVPAHLTRYVAEVETWRLEALVARAARVVQSSGAR